MFFPALRFFSLLVITGQMIGVLQECRAPWSIGKLYGDIKSGMVGTLSHKNDIYFAIVVLAKHTQIQNIKKTIL